MSDRASLFAIGDRVRIVTPGDTFEGRFATVYAVNDRLGYYLDVEGPNGGPMWFADYEVAAAAVPEETL